MSVTRRSALAAVGGYSCAIVAVVCMVLSVVGNGCSRSSSSNTGKGREDEGERQAEAAKASSRPGTHEKVGVGVEAGPESAMSTQPSTSRPQGATLPAPTTSAASNDLTLLVKAAHGANATAREKAIGELFEHLAPGADLADTQALLGPAANLTEMETSKGRILMATYYARLKKGPKGTSLMTVEFERRGDRWAMVAVRGPHYPDAGRMNPRRELAGPQDVGS